MDYTKTSFENKCSILSEVWMDYRNEDEFKDFTEYNDLGLPLAYAIHSGIVKDNGQAGQFVEETFDILLNALSIPDTGYEYIDEMLTDAEEAQGNEEE